MCSSKKRCLSKFSDQGKILNVDSNSILQRISTLVTFLSVLKNCTEEHPNLFQITLQVWDQQTCFYDEYKYGLFAG